MLYHAAGPTEIGWQVVEVWESPEAADRFFRATLGPALQRANLPPGPPQDFPAHNSMRA